MRVYSTLLISGLLAIRPAIARDVPANVKSFVSNVKIAGQCSNNLQTGFYAKDDGPNTFSYCGDHLNDYKIIYLQGTGGALADMDIDCDGLQNGSGDDGRCASSEDTQSQTSFQATVAGYNKGVSDLNAFIHTYVVFGNVGTKAGYKNFNPQSQGIHPLSLMAVVCDNKMFYGIWGDENGDDGPKAVIGEASISMATLCFDTKIGGDRGHDETDVMYIAFTGADAVPGANGAKWNAGSATEFENSLATLGDKLVQRIRGGSPSTMTTTTKPPTSTNLPPPSCTACNWTAHCAGATCSTANDCDGDLTCINGKCGGCTWAGHCACAACSTGDDCSDDLVCKSGKCAAP